MRRHIHRLVDQTSTGMSESSQKVRVMASRLKKGGDPLPRFLKAGTMALATTRLLGGLASVEGSKSSWKVHWAMSRMISLMRKPVCYKQVVYKNKQSQLLTG